MALRLLAVSRRVGQSYLVHLRAFSPNARLYLLTVILQGVMMGVFRLLFNFYVLSLGYDEALLGRLVTTSNLSALLAALPIGYLADQLGRKYALILSGSLTCLSILGMVLWPTAAMLYCTNVLWGVAQSLGAVSMGPFLMENSGELERTYLFSFSSGLQMAAVSVGNWIGGYLPTWMGTWLNADPLSSQAYGASLFAVVLAGGLAVLPLIFLRSLALPRAQRSVFAPLQYASAHPATLTRLVLPMLVTSLGAGLIMPFMNVFFRQVYHQSDTTIGAMFAWGSLAMGAGLLIAPPLAERMGKVQLVVISQALSIPFLILLGFAPWFWLSAASYYIRVGLMNMSSPVYQTFVMEQVEAQARATIASLISMAWNFGWAFSPMISGWLQVGYGFGPAFLGTLILYILSTLLYWAFFWRGAPRSVSALASTD